MCLRIDCRILWTYLEVRWYFYRCFYAAPRAIVVVAIGATPPLYIIARLHYFDKVHLVCYFVICHEPQILWLFSFRHPYNLEELCHLSTGTSMVLIDLLLVLLHPATCWTLRLVADECSFGSFVVLLILVTVTFCHLGLHCIRGYTA